MYQRLSLSQRPRILLLGDSITEQAWDAGSLPPSSAAADGVAPWGGVGGGWAAQLAHWYRRKADIVNRGFSGYNSRWILSILDRLVPAASGGSSNEWSNIILATIFLGANDSVINAEGQLVPVEEYKENIRAIIRHLQRCNNDVHIVLITPPKVDSSMWPTRSIERVSVFADAVRALAAEEATGGRRVHLVDLWEGDICVEIPDLRDGLHLGFVGSHKVAAGIMRIVRTEIPELCPEGDGSSCPMPSHFPAWNAFLDVGEDGATVNVPQSPLKAVSVASEWKWD